MISRRPDGPDQRAADEVAEHAAEPEPPRQRHQQNGGGEQDGEGQEHAQPMETRGGKVKPGDSPAWSRPGRRARFHLAPTSATLRAIKGNGALSFSNVFARGVALVGGGALLVRRLKDGTHEPAWGAPRPFRRPSRKAHPDPEDADRAGWAPGQTPVAAPGLKVNAFATGLMHPRWIHVLPNGDVLVAEATNVPRPHAQRVRLRHGQHDAARRGRGRQRQPDHPAARRRRRRGGRDPRAFIEGLNQPFGMACWATRSTSATPTAWWCSPTSPAPTASPRRAASWWSSSPAGTGPGACCRARTGRSCMPGSVRSSNIGDNGMEAEEGRAAIYEIDLATGNSRIFASGLRNAGRLGVGADHRRAVDGGQRT